MDKEHNGARVALHEALKNAEPPSRASQLTLRVEDPVHQPREEFDPTETHAADLLGLPKVAEKRALIVSTNNAGKGRPRGRHNHRTQAWVDHLLKRYPSPLETLAQIQASPIDALASELGCSRLEALTQKRHAAEALAPFVHQKLSSIEIKPPGHPDGEPVTLRLAPQGVFAVDDEEDDVIEAVALEAAQRLGETSSAAPALPSENGDGANSYCAPLGKIDADGEGSDTSADAVLDALIEQARHDPELAARIRQRLASLE